MLIPWERTKTHAHYSYFFLTFSPTFILSSNRRLHTKSFPNALTFSFSTVPLSCFLERVQVYVEIYPNSIFRFKVRFIGGTITGGCRQQKAPCLWLLPPLSWVCVSSVHWIGGWKSGAVHIGNEWLTWGWKRGHPSKNYSVLVPYLIWSRQSVLALKNGPTLLDQLPALLCDIALQRGNLWGALPSQSLSGKHYEAQKSLERQRCTESWSTCINCR